MSPGQRIFICFLIAAFCQVVKAQEVRATVSGRVIDAQGAVVPKAAVTVISDETGVKQETRTNNQGNWIVQFLLPGHYSFTVSVSGFKTETRRGIELQAADNKQFDLRLELGSSTQTVDVTAEPPLIDTTSATSGTVISSREIDDLPSQTHVATLLATLSPGVVAQYQNGNVVHLWSYNGASQFTSNGGRNNIFSNNFLLDGMPDVRAGGNISFIPAQDSVQEFRVQTNAYDGSIERQNGSTINMQTKSGTNRYHGLLYEYNQNNVFNANLFQTNLVGGAVPPVHFNEFGGTFGGPVRIPKVYNGREKTFFFVSWDDTHNIDPRPGGTRSVPTALERQGDFSQSFTTNTINGSLVRFPIQVYDPLTVDSKGNRQLFPGEKVPVNRLNPIALKILNYVPLPNTQGDNTGNAVNNFVSGATRTDTFPVLSIRGDQNWSNSQRSFAVVRWAHLHESLDDFFDNPATGSEAERVPENIGLDHVWIVSANKILDMRFNVNRYLQPSHDDGAGFDPTQLGFSSSFVSQLSKPSFPRIVGIAGDFGTSQAGTYQNNTYYTWMAGFTHTHGNHTMRYGAEYWVLQEADGGIGVQPEFDFNSPVWTRQNATITGGTGVGSNFGSFLLGLPNGGSVPNNATAFYSQRFMAFYFHDDWRVTSRLTLNFGLHWDYERPVTERYDRLTSNYDATVTNPISAPAQAAYAQILNKNASNPTVQLLAQIVPANAFKVPGAQLFAGVNGQARTVFDPDYHEWQPRVGFAYRIGPNTVFRGGFGRFTQAEYEKAGQNGFSLATPLVASQDNNFTPYDTLGNPFRSGVLAPTGSSLGPLTNLGQGVQWLNQDAGRTYSWEYSFHLQHQIKKWLFELGYSHNKAYNIYWGLNKNLPSFSLWQQLQTPQFDSKGRPPDQLEWNMLVPNPFYKLPGVTGSIGSSQNVALNQLINPSPLLGSITQNDNPWGSNQYDAMLAKVEHRFSDGFSLIGSFTWSKLFEDTSFLGPEIAGPIKEHKLGGEDRPFVFSIAPIWEIPFGRNKKWGSNIPKALDFVLGGWELSGRYTAQSGIPVPFTTDSFFSGKDFSLPNDKRSLNQWFDTSQFIRFPDKNTDVSSYPTWTGIQSLPGYNYKPAAGDSIKNGVYQDFANFVRTFPTRWSDIRGPGVNSFDVGIFKSFHPVERVRLQLKFEAFNALNHPRFDSPNSDPTSSQFGRITPMQQNNARLIQMSGRLSF
jgi:hypothetical protein